jgi:hypothetical protein
MMKMTSRFFSFVLMSALVAGCSFGDSADANKSLPSELFSSVKKVIAAQGEGPVAAVTPSREVIQGLTEPVLQIDPELAGGSDFLRRVESRTDSSGRTNEVWRSSLKANVFLRNGVLVGTRGVGSDIISADAKYTARALAARSNGSGARSYTISDGDLTTTRYEFNCRYENLGAKNIVVAYQLFSTTHMREICVQTTPDNNTITNDYWVEAGTKTVRQSRQWVSPKAGYFQFKLLKK